MQVLNNGKDLWYKEFPFPKEDHNKYSKGHVLVTGGEIMTGAACLAAEASLRAGAGIVTVGCLGNSHPIYASSLKSVISKPLKDMLSYTKMLEDDRINTVLTGPGCGVGEFTKNLVKESLKYNKVIIIDADAITSFKDDPEELFEIIRNSNSKVIFTPHEGEFVRLFKVTQDRMQDVCDASKKSNSVIILKGSKTLIAINDNIVINQEAPPYLATAGTGDVLSGIISGLVAGKMDLYKACCAAVWIHSKAGFKAGYGMIAEDLLFSIKEVLSELLNYSKN